MGFINALFAITEPGDEIVLLRPYYFNHEMAIGMVGCRIVEVDTDEQHQPDVEAIAAAITPRTKAIVTISPNNPTGVVYSEAALRRINPGFPFCLPRMDPLYTRKPQRPTRIVFIAQSSRF